MQGTTAAIVKKTLIILGFSAMSISLLTSSTAAAEDIVIPLGSFGGRPVVEVLFPGGKTVSMIIDTGARGVVMANEIGTEMNLEVMGEARIGSPGGGGMPAVVYKPQVLDLNGYQFTPSNLIGLDFSGLRQGPPPKEGGPDNPVEEGMIPPGVLGFWEFREGVVGVDFGASTLTLSPNGTLDSKGAHTLPLTVMPGFPYPQFEMSVGGIAVNGHIDTGAPGVFIMSTDWMENLPLKGEPVKMGEARLADGVRDIWKAVLDGTVTVGGYTLENPEIHFLESVTGVNVGTGFFQGGGFKIDRQNDLIELDRNET